ncbi:MAG TPA: sel1 repeat family protein, partial [Candidatus Aquabacterium excrementipullorum]|nr:sel1 repeat family protein [Candidatus Aquabacterium excrementipullorum]
ALSSDPVNETIDLVQDLIRRNIPAGYYDMGWYLEHGYGVRVDQDLAFKYYRRSADMGSPNGQFLVGHKLADERKNGTEIAAIGWSMYRCAADQGHVKAAEGFGDYLQQEGRFAEALKYFQKAVSSGSPVASLSLARAFDSKGGTDPIFALGQAADGEREQRYSKIEDFLTRYDYLNPTVAEIDEIVPLPPVKLPLWDGKFKWLEEYKADKVPVLPAGDRINEMAKAKGLDPRNGHALSSK